MQFALTILLMGVLLYFLANRNRTAVRAWKRAGLVALILLGIAAVVVPDALNAIANAVGIGRGADLLLYLTVVAFVFVALNVYLKFQDYGSRMVEIARAVALLDAEIRSRGQEELTPSTGPKSGECGF